jgi:hypothetical protein
LPEAPGKETTLTLSQAENKGLGLSEVDQEILNSGYWQLQADFDWDNLLNDY